MATKTQINDLEILLSLKNETEKAFNKVEDDLMSVDKLARVAGGALAGMGASAAAAFGVATKQGFELQDELRVMATLINVNTEEAGQLYGVFKEQNPRVQIDGLSDGVRTLTERFSEARVETGELFNFAKDFGLEFDASISGANNQTIEFLKTLRQLPDAGDRMTTAIAVMGDAGAEQFQRIIADTETLDETIAMLEENVHGVFDEDQARNVDEYAESTTRLQSAWESLGLTLSTKASPFMSAVNNVVAFAVEKTDDLIGKLDEFRETESQFLTFEQRKRAGIELTALSPDDIIAGQRDSENKRIASERADERLKAKNAAEELEKLEAKRAREAERAAKAKEREAASQARLLEREVAQIEAQEQRLIEQRNQEELRRIEEAENRAPDELDLLDIEDQQEPIRKIIDGLLGDGDDTPSEEISTLAENADQASTAINGIAGAVSNVANAFNSKGRGALKELIYLQGIAATASAYAAGAQALAGFDSATTFDRIAKAAQVVAIGLNYVAQIKTLAGKIGGSSAGGGDVGSTSPQVPQAAPITETAQAQPVVSINVQSRTPGSLLTVDDINNLFEQASNIPGNPIYRLNETFTG